MDLWFDREQQKEKLLNYLPKGRAYKQAWVDGSNFNKLIAWMASAFRFLIDMYNDTFKGLYLCESKQLIEKWRRDYNIPNEIFYLNDAENITDAYVLKYLMKGNTEWHFRAIANIYGVEVSIHSGVEFFKDSRLPHKVPHRLYAEHNVGEVIVVIFKGGSEILKNKIKAIYGIIKSAESRVVYKEARYTLVNQSIINRLPHKLPQKLGTRQVQTKVFEEAATKEMIKFCKGVQL